MSNKFSEGKPYKVIALCLTRFKEYDQARVIGEMCRTCHENNIKIMMFTSVTDLYDGGLNDIGEAQIFSSFDVTRFDAVVVMSESFKHSDVLNNLVNNAIRHDVPVISVDKEIDGCINVIFDYAGSFEQIVRHVIDVHNAKTINIIAGNRGNHFSEERLECVRRIFKEKNITYDEDRVLYGDFWSDPTRAVLEEFFASGKSIPDAFICANDIMAIECMRTLKSHGYKVPDDVIVTGFDGIDLERFYSPRLTTAEYDLKALADAIYDAVDKNVNGKHDISPRIVKYVNRLGGSCGCVQAATDDVEERLYLEKFITDDMDEFTQYMFNMIAKLSNFPDLHYIFPPMPEHLKRVNIKELWMCFNDDFIDENMNISSDYSDKYNVVSKYTEYMRVPLHMNEGELLDTKYFVQRDMLPDIEKILDTNDYLMFVPVHLQGITVGYMANTFDMEKFKFGYFQNYLQDFRHILNVYVNRAINEKIYVSDALTGIYNRHGFYRNIGDILKNSRKNKIPFTIISLDMDGLKKINDTYGHAEGDYSLRTIAQAMKKAMNTNEVCSRFGGDEFIIAFCCQDGMKRGKEIMDTIEHNLKNVNEFGTKPYYVNVSMGVYSKVCEEQDTLDDFIKYADDLMYADKNKHKQKIRNGAE